MDAEEKEPASGGPDWLNFVDHTADSGILVRAADLKELFARAAWGMFSLITDPNSVRPIQKTPIVVEAGDRDALMVRWLSELNYRHVTEQVLFSKFHIDELTNKRLEADAWGEMISLARHTIYTEIKAITFHGLRIEQTGEGWKAQIIFDL